VHEPVEAERVAEDPADRTGKRPPQEVLLATHTRQVAERVLDPLPVHEHLEVPGADVHERGLPVEREATRFGDGEAGFGVTYRGVERDRHPTDQVDEPLELREVDLDVVVDRDEQVPPRTSTGVFTTRCTTSST
jgi:hypothetical protein